MRKKRKKIRKRGRKSEGKVGSIKYQALDTNYLMLDTGLPLTFGRFGCIMEIQLGNKEG